MLAFASMISGRTAMNSVKEFYRDAQKEWDRLDLPLCQIEFASTLRLIDEHLKKCGTVADIGGGPGRYTLELLKRGHRVTLFDLSPENIALAQTMIGRAGLEAEDFLVGDARNLSALQGRRFDAILALGPLYHLAERTERIAFLEGAKPLLNSGGILIACYLNAWGIARTLLSDSPGWFTKDSLRLLRTGESFSGTQACSGFTECHWSNPDLARAELKEAGFAPIEEIGAEGFAGGCRKEVEAIAANDPQSFRHIVALGVETSALPQYRHATDHLLFVASAAAQ